MFICLTATKFEHFIFSVLGFALAYILNIHIIIILNDFCLFPAYFGYVIINVWRSVWWQEVDLDEGAGSRNGRNMCGPIGRWVKSVHGSATGGERKDMKVTLTGIVWWVSLKRRV